MLCRLVGEKVVCLLGYVLTAIRRYCSRETPKNSRYSHSMCRMWRLMRYHTERLDGREVDS